VVDCCDNFEITNLTVIVAKEGTRLAEHSALVDLVYVVHQIAKAVDQTVVLVASLLLVLIARLALVVLLQLVV
jgi:hypothetical protein